MQRVIVFGLFMILFTGCIEKVKDTNLPDHEEAMVVEALLTPDQPVNVYVDQSQGITNRIPREYLESVEVTLLENGNKLGMLEDSTNGIYHYPQAPKPNKQYQIKAKHEAIGQVSGTVKIPEQVAIESVKFEDSAHQVPAYDVLHAITFEFIDPQGITNYYSIRGTWQDSNVKHNRSIQLLYYNPGVNFEFKEALFMDDEGLNKGANSFTVYLDGEVHEPQKIKEDLEIRLRHITESYFLYARQLNLQESSGGGGPFSGEPAMSYSNVENGYGVIAGMNESVGDVD